MDFTNRIDIRNYLNSLKRVPHDPNKSANASYFGRIDLNSFYVDISAGPLSCCEPKRDLDYLGWYKKISLHLYEVIKEQDHSISPNQDNRFAGFHWLKYFTFIDPQGRVKPSYMGEMISIDDTIDFIRDVYKISRLKIFF